MKAQSSKRTVYQFGFWSAALVTVETVLFFLSLAMPNKTLMFASSFLLAPTFVAMMIPTLVVPAISLPVNEAGTGVGDKVDVYANMVWSVYFGVTTVLVTLLFRRLAEAR